jgi:DNA adenine methylase
MQISATSPHASLSGGRPESSARPAQRRAVISPLRYPGGKRRLVPYIAAALRANDLRPDLFVEPYAGGASVALELAATGVVRQIGIADVDPWIASFWETVFEDCDWLCRRVESITVDIATWDRLKRIRAKSRRWQALACLFLNRTSFNGALHPRAGPIGGRAQTSGYDLACRFPRERLIARLRACERLATDGKVAWVRCAPALEVIGDARRQAKRESLQLFTYLDPPFWAKSRELYRYSFEDREHRELAQALLWLRESWLLSYDVSPQIERLYDRHDVRRANVELLYTATRRAVYEELVITSLATLPVDTRLWRTKAEWTQMRACVRESD